MFLLGDSLLSEFYMPTFRNTLSHLHRWRKERIQHSEHGERFKSRTSQIFDKIWQIVEGTLWTSRISNRQAHSQECSVIVNKRVCLCCGMRCEITIQVCAVGGNYFSCACFNMAGCATTSLGRFRLTFL